MWRRADEEKTEPNVLHSLTLGHEYSVACVCFSPDGSSLAAGCDDHSIRIWDLDSGIQESNLTGHAGSVIALRFSLDGSTLVSGSAEDSSLRVFEKASGRLLSSTLERIVCFVCVSSDAPKVGIGCFDCSLRAYDVSSKNLIFATFTGHASPVGYICFSPDGLKVASRCVSDYIKIWDIVSRRNRLRKYIRYELFVLFS